MRASKVPRRWVTADQYRDLGIGVDDEGERGLHRGKGVDHLHQPAERDLLGEIARRHHDHREDHRHLGVARGEPVQKLAAFHDPPKIVVEEREALPEDVELRLLAAVERDAFGVLAQTHQAVAEIGLETLLLRN